MYNLVGKAVVRFSWRYVRLRYRREAGTCIACFRPALVSHVRPGARWRFVWEGDAVPQIVRERPRPR